ncbi:MAG: tetratricopeptide repeat protein [Sphingobium sp.]|nr:tetratricopeptide repeat protein [Sphingobium sp.]
MFKFSLKIAGGAAIAALASVAAVASGPAETPYASTAIASGQFNEAERMLQPASYADAQDPARLINLATIYLQAQRFDKARAMLQQVNRLPDEALVLASGASYNSHDIAKAMLHRLP